MTPEEIKLPEEGLREMTQKPTKETKTGFWSGSFFFVPFVSFC
jgi:hypothetical protein